MAAWAIFNGLRRYEFLVVMGEAESVQRVAGAQPIF